MSAIATRQQASEADYEAIALAVMETERGRWFLGEYARRNRHADTETLLSALQRIERSVVHRDVGEIDKFRMDVLEMSKAIARTHAEIAAIKPDDARGGPITEASGELDSIVAATETATSDILAAAERVQETAWTLREASVDAGFCDALDARATEIYTACSFQDLTAQRIRKVIETLGFLEKRVAAMVDIWQLAEGADESQSNASGSSLLDPAMSQADVDDVLVHEAMQAPDAAFAAAFNQEEASDKLGLQSSAVAPPTDILALSASPPPGSDADTVELDMAHPLNVLPLQHGEPEDIDEILFTEPAPMAPQPEPMTADRLQLVHSRPPVDDAIQKVRSGAELSADEAARALDALKAMSIEERTRLFS